LNGAATLLGLDHVKGLAWISKQPVWSPDAVLRVACAVQAQLAAETRATKLQREVDKLSTNLASTYEEICLLHGVTQNLRIRSDEEQLCSLVLRWLLDCLPAEAVAIQLLPVAKEGQITYKARTSSVLYTAGQCPLDDAEFSRLIEALGLEAGCGPLVANRQVTGGSEWTFPGVRELIVVPMGGWSIHLDGHLGMVDVDKALVDVPGLPYWFLERLRELGIEAIPCPRGEEWAINSLVLRPGRVLMCDRYQRAAELLERRGIEVVGIPYDEIQKGGGGIHCSTMELVRDPG